MLSVGEARRSEKEVVMKGCVAKVKLVKEFALAEVSKLPVEEAMGEEKEKKKKEWRENL